jgi:hypothetical protein
MLLSCARAKSSQVKGSTANAACISKTREDLVNWFGVGMYNIDNLGAKRYSRYHRADELREVLHAQDSSYREARNLHCAAVSLI